jgi:hypothetical protein
MGPRNFWVPEPLMPGPTFAVVITIEQALLQVEDERLAVVVIVRPSQREKFICREQTTGSQEFATALECSRSLCLSHFATGQSKTTTIGDRVTSGSRSTGIGSSRRRRCRRGGHGDRALDGFGVQVLALLAAGGCPSAVRWQVGAGAVG